MSTPEAGARIGFIGLGSMGAPMAKRLLDWPGGLTVCDTRAEAVAPFTDAGAESASSAAELAAKCAVISVVVVDDAQVRQVVAGPGGLLETAAPAPSSRCTPPSAIRRRSTWPLDAPSTEWNWSTHRSAVARPARTVVRWR